MFANVCVENETYVTMATKCLAKCFVHTLAMNSILLGILEQKQVYHDWLYNQIIS